MTGVKRYAKRYYMAREGDIVLVAGKGHEEYQEIKSAKHRFSDREVIEEVLKVRPGI